MIAEVSSKARENERIAVRARRRVEVFVYLGLGPNFPVTGPVIGVELLWIDRFPVFVALSMMARGHEDR